jgi:multisubunit Na+/H+ antiporter MnhG subunit
MGSVSKYPFTKSYSGIMCLFEMGVIAIIRPQISIAISSAILQIVIPEWDKSRVDKSTKRPSLNNTGAPHS